MLRTKLPAKDPHKPHIWFETMYQTWACGCRNGRGEWHYTLGRTPQRAYKNFKEYVEHLEAAGLRWEVFP